MNSDVVYSSWSILIYFEVLQVPYFRICMHKPHICTYMCMELINTYIIIYAWYVLTWHIPGTFFFLLAASRSRFLEQAAT